MLGKLLGPRNEVFLVEPETRLEVRYDPPHFVLDDRPMTAETTAAHILELFLEERRLRKKPLVARREGDYLEVVLERLDPDRFYRFRIHPRRATVAWTEELRELPDARIPLLEPTWSCHYSAPPWPARSGHTSLSAAWLPEGVLFLLGDWLAWIEPDTGKVLGEWPLPGKAGSRATVELLTPTEQGVLGSYRVFEGEVPVIAGMLLLKLDGQPRWKLTPTRKGSIQRENPVEPHEGRVVVETRVYAGEDYLPSRAQWVVDLRRNESYTALLGGPPRDRDVVRCLSLLPDLPNRLELEPRGVQVVGSNPVHKLTSLPAFPLQAGQETIYRGAVWQGAALAYELCPDHLQLYAWHDPRCGFALCRVCRQRVPAGVYHCPCGAPWKP